MSVGSQGEGREGQGGGLGGLCCVLCFVCGVVCVVCYAFVCYTLCNADSPFLCRFLCLCVYFSLFWFLSPLFSQDLTRTETRGWQCLRRVIERAVCSPPSPRPPGRRISWTRRRFSGSGRRRTTLSGAAACFDGPGNGTQRHYMGLFDWDIHTIHTILTLHFSH